MDPEIRLILIGLMMVIVVFAIILGLHAATKAMMLGSLQVFTDAMAIF
jgi:hypothetical protein